MIRIHVFKPITIAMMNCQSIKNKKAVFNVFIDEHQPNKIIGSESWISPAVHSDELFPANYNVYRKDREDAYGGVFILYSKRLFSENLPLIQHVQWLCAIFGCPTQTPWFFVQHTDLLAVTVCTWSSCVKHRKR